MSLHPGFGLFSLTMDRHCSHVSHNCCNMSWRRAISGINSSNWIHTNNQHVSRLSILGVGSTRGEEFELHDRTLKEYPIPTHTWLGGADFVISFPIISYSLLDSRVLIGQAYLTIWFSCVDWSSLSDDFGPKQRYILTFLRKRIISIVTFRHLLAYGQRWK